MALLPHQKHALLFLARHLAAGVAGGFSLGLLMLYFDIHGLRTLVGASSDGWLYVVLLFFGLFVTFGGVGMAVGIMSLGEERDD